MNIRKEHVHVGLFASVFAATSLRAACIAAIGALLLSSGLARAELVTWTLKDAVLIDGGKISGWILYETIGDDLFSWDITVTPGTIPTAAFTTGYEYTPHTSTWQSGFRGPPRIDFESRGEYRVLELRFTPPGLDLIGSSLVVYGTEILYTGQSRSFVGSITSVPEPSAIAVLLIGAGVLVAGRIHRCGGTAQRS